LLSRQAESGRYNNTELYSISQEEPFAQSPFNCVTKGTYLSGPRRGQACVVKRSKSIGVCLSDDAYAVELKLIDKALEIIHRFNQIYTISSAIRPLRLKLNVPILKGVCFIDDPDEELKALVEPFIENYRKFDKSDDNAEDSIVAELVDALSHFSYQATGGHLVLCDLRGGIDHQRNEIVLTHPVV